MQASGLKATSLAKRISTTANPISHTAIQNYLSGDSLPNADKLFILADFFGVTTDYLLTGRGDSLGAQTESEWKFRALGAE